MKSTSTRGNSYSIKNFTPLSKLKEAGEAVLLVLGILALAGISLAACYGMGCGIYKLISKIGPVRAVMVTGLAAVASVWAICFISKYIPGKTPKSN